MILKGSERTGEPFEDCSLSNRTCVSLDGARLLLSAHFRQLLPLCLLLLVMTACPVAHFVDQQDVADIMQCQRSMYVNARLVKRSRLVLIYILHCVIVTFCNTIYCYCFVAGILTG